MPLAFLDNIGLPELMVIGLAAVLIFGKNLPQAASKAYVQFRKFRNAVDDLRRESGIDREMREIERTVREAEWEARKAATTIRKDIPDAAAIARGELPAPPPVRRPGPPVAVEAQGESEEDAQGAETAPAQQDPPAPTDAGS